MLEGMKAWDVSQWIASIVPTRVLNKALSLMPNTAKNYNQTTQPHNKIQLQKIYNVESDSS